MYKRVSIFTLAVLVAGSLNAAVLEQTVAIGTHGPGSFSNPTTQDLTFDQFDDQGGTLTLQSVRVEYLLRAWGGYIGVDNDGDTIADADVELYVEGGLSSTDISLVNGSLANPWSDLSVLQSDTFILQANDDTGDDIGRYTEGGEDWAELEGPVEAAANTQSADDYISSAAFSNYIGSGQYTILFSSSQSQSASGGGNIHTTTSPQTSSGEVKITYEYIPEPMSMGLVVMLVAGGIAVRNIRRRFI